MFQFCYIIVNVHNSAVIELQNISHMIMIINLYQMEDCEIRFETLKLWSSYLIISILFLTWLINCHSLNFFHLKHTHNQSYLLLELFPSSKLSVWSWCNTHRSSKLLNWLPTLQNLKIFIWMRLPSQETLSLGFQTRVFLTNLVAFIWSNVSC